MQRRPVEETALQTVVVARNALEKAIVVVCSVVLWVSTMVIFVILSFLFGPFWWVPLVMSGGGRGGG